MKESIRASLSNECKTQLPVFSLAVQNSVTVLRQFCMNFIGFLSLFESSSKFFLSRLKYCMINVLLILEIILPFVITVDIAVDIAFALLKELYLNRHNSGHLKHLVTAPSPLQHLDYGMNYHL